MKIKENLKKLKNILLIIGIIIVCISGAFALKYNVIDNSSLEFDLELYTLRHPVYGGLPIRIDATLYIPKLEYNWYLYNLSKMPVIILAHGFACDKSFFRGLALEFTKRGFACVSITARGHHGSGGILGLTWEDEILTAIDYVEMLANANFPFDINRIGLVGHSMGAYSVTLAASIDSRINATVAIAGPLVNMSRGNPILDILNGGGLGMDFNRIPLLFPGLMPYLQYPIGYIWEMYSGNAIIEDKVNRTTPNNYLNIIGSIDEAFSILSAQEVLWYMGLKDPPYNVTHYWHVLRNHLYGEFNGTARKLTVIPMTDHIFEPNHPVTIYESINWMEKSMKLTHPIFGSIEYLIYQVLFRDSIGEILRTAAPWLDIIGVIIISFPLAAYLGNWLKSKFTKAQIAKKIENKKMWFMFLIYGIAFVLISLITMPVINALNIVPWTDFLGTNMLHMFLVVQSVLFLPVLIALLIYERWKFKENLDDFGIEPRAFPKSAMFGIILALFVFIILNIIVTPTYFNISITRPQSFLEIFMYMLLVFAVSEILFHGLIQNKLSRYRNSKVRFIPKFLSKEIILSSLITGLIQGLGFGIIFSMFIDHISLVPVSSSIIELMFGRQVPPLPLPMYITSGCILFFIVLSLINNWLYKRTKNVLGLIIFNAFFISWMSTLLPAISGPII